MKYNVIVNEASDVKVYLWLRRHKLYATSSFNCMPKINTLAMGLFYIVHVFTYLLLYSVTRNSSQSFYPRKVIRCYIPVLFPTR